MYITRTRCATGHTQHGPYQSIADDYYFRDVLRHCQGCAEDAAFSIRVFDWPSMQVTSLVACWLRIASSFGHSLVTIFELCARKQV